MDPLLGGGGGTWSRPLGDTPRSLQLTLHRLVVFPRSNRTRRADATLPTPMIAGAFRPADAVASAELVPSRRWDTRLGLLEAPRRLLKSAAGYFSPGGKDQLVDRYDPISRPVEAPRHSSADKPLRILLTDLEKKINTYGVLNW